MAGAVCVVAYADRPGGRSPVDLRGLGADFFPDKPSAFASFLKSKRTHTSQRRLHLGAEPQRGIGVENVESAH